MNFSVSDVSLWEIFLLLLQVISIFLFFFPCQRRWRCTCREGKVAQNTTHTRTCHGIQMCVCVPATALCCLFPDTAQHSLQIRIYLTQLRTQRGIKRDNQPEKELETLTHRATEGIVIFLTRPSLAVDWSEAEVCSFCSTVVSLGSVKPKLISALAASFLMSSSHLISIPFPISCSLLYLLYTNLSSLFI